MDARVISAFTRVFDALLPAHDGTLVSVRYLPVLILVHSRFISRCVLGSCALMV
jgi:hypothetical protein